MVQNDPFFKLAGTPSKIDQMNFYAHMGRSDHLCDTIYEPDELDRNAGRTTRLEAKTFERVSFSKTKIKNIIFRGCTFKDCLFIGSIIERCEFHNGFFIRSNTHKISFFETYIDPKSFLNSLDKKKHQNIGVHLYQSLMKNNRDNDQPEFEADAHFYFLRWKRYQNIYEIRKSWVDHKHINFKLRMKAMASFLWEWLCGSGIRLRHFFATVIVSVFFITSVNFVFRQELGLDGGQGKIISFIDSFYFSTVTLTTLGFGDIFPTTQLGKLFVAAQGVFGFFIFALLASMLFRKMAP